MNERLPWDVILKDILILKEECTVSFPRLIMVPDLGRERDLAFRFSHTSDSSMALVRDLALEFGRKFTPSSKYFLNKLGALEH